MKAVGFSYFSFCILILKAEAGIWIWSFMQTKKSKSPRLAETQQEELLCEWIVKVLQHLLVKMDDVNPNFGSTLKK